MQKPQINSENSSNLTLNQQIHRLKPIEKTKTRLKKSKFLILTVAFTLSR